MAERYWIETLGCPKNQVDSDKLVGTLVADGFEAARTPEQADLVVVNTCAFIEAARQESVDTVLALADTRRDGARLVVTGCMAERYGDELAEALPEVDLVAPFGVSLTGLPAPTSAPSEAAPHSATPVLLGRKPTPAVPSFDLLNLPRPPSTRTVVLRQGGRGMRPQLRLLRHPVVPGQATLPLHRVDPGRGGPAGRSRRPAPGGGPGGPGPLLVRPRPLHRPDAVPAGRPASRAATARSSTWWRRWPAGSTGSGCSTSTRPTLDDALVEAVLATGVPYFDLSLQHVSRPLLKRMRRWGEGDRFLDRITSIRASEPTAAFRSSFIVGYPGETEADHDRLLEWLSAAQLDWVGFFPFSNEAGTHAAGLPDQVDADLVAERLRECAEVQDAITARRRDELLGATVEVLVDAPGEGRTYREAPEIDGIVSVPADLPVGSFAEVVVTGADGPDLLAEPAPGSGAKGVRPLAVPAGANP